MPSCGVVEGCVRAVHGDAGPRQGQQHPALRRGVGQPLHGSEKDGMVRHDQADAFRDGLGRAVRRDGETGHEAPHLGGALAEQQADVVPVGGQRRRGEALQEFHDGGDGGHDVPLKFLGERRGVSPPVRPEPAG